MNIGDIRLNEDELDDAIHNPPTTIFNEWLTPEEEARHIANTATDKAIKMMIELVEKEGRFGSRGSSDRTKNCTAYAINDIEWQALKKMVREGNSESL